ncbi:MAG: hypothetical protein KGJ06_06245 [Pseudomonadota bacterium]|nr:hypothetical protein [Pseudomonadota bacterium]
MDENEAADEKPNWLERFKKTSLDRLPTMEELARAAAAPHDADVEFLRYLSLRPSIVRLMEMKETMRAEASDEWKPEPKPLMERIREELRAREQRGEKGGELLP